MNGRVTLGYATAGVVIAASAIAATAATVGLGAGAPQPAAAHTPSATASVPQREPAAGSALVTTPGGGTLTLAPGERITGSQVLQTPAGPVEYVMVENATAPARDAEARAYRAGHEDHDDDDDHDEREGHDDHEDDEDDEDEEREGLRRLLSVIRGDRR